MPARADQMPKELHDLDGLVKKYGKFTVVMAVAKRAKDLKEHVESVLAPGSGSLIRRAITEIADGAAKIRPAIVLED